jgi:hypothetical protein
MMSHIQTTQSYLIMMAGPDIPRGISTSGHRNITFYDSVLHFESALIVMCGECNFKSTSTT